MNWEAYEKKLKKKAVRSEFSFSFDGVLSDDIMPPLAKASSYLLKDAISGGAKRMLMVLPENQDLACVLFLEKLLSDINDGTIKSDYDVTKFNIGEKVSIGKAIIEYRGTYYNSEKNEEFITLRMKDKTGPMTVYAPLSMIPILQHANTTKGLSKAAVYEEEKAKFEPTIDNTYSGIIGKIASVRTHLSGTTLLVGYSKRTRELISKSFVNDVALPKVLSVAQADLEGTIKRTGAIDANGVPGLVITSDLYSASVIADSELPINSITIVAEKPSSVIKELDSLDELLELDIPLTVILDNANSMELGELFKREFFLWRWNRNWLTSNMIGEYETEYLTSIDNIQSRNISYESIPEELVSETFSLIVRNRSLVESQVSSINTIFDKLFDLAFQTVRMVVPIDEVSKEAIRNELDHWRTEMEGIKGDFQEEEYKDFKKAIANLKAIYKLNSEFPKVAKLKTLLSGNIPSSIVMAFPSSHSFDIEGIQTYWQSWMNTQSIDATLNVYSFSDYFLLSPAEDTLTIICGWFNADRMRRLLYSNKTSDYYVLLYDCESLWRGNLQAKWDWEIDKNNNVEICSNYLHVDVEEEIVEEPDFDEKLLEESEDIYELEKYASTIKYKKYLHNASVSETELISAIPVFFSNGAFMFMRLGQEVVSISKMLLEDWDDIERKDSLELVVGDYIVFRESGKDLIKEVADSLLEKGGQIDARQVASKWRQALDLELMFSSEDEIYQKMKRQGWAKTKDTLQRWIMDKTLIAPQTRRDIEILVEATDNAVTGEMIDEIYNSSRVVKNAHINAGKLLSSRLKKELGHYVKEMAVDMDSHKDSIDIMIEDVGTIKILRITNIGEQAQVNNSYVGRLMQD